MSRKFITRRTFIKTTGVAGTLAATGGLAMPAIAAPKTIRIGFVSPETGPLAIFAEPDRFTIEQFSRGLADGLMINGTKHPVEIIVKDSQSSSNRASSVAQDLIFGDRVDILCAASTPDTTNPVADQAELNGVPCVTNDTPWQPHFFGRQGDPKTGFQYTYHFFWGLEDVISTFINMWDEVPTNKVVGALWPNDPDGNGWSDKTVGFPPVMEKRGYSLVDPGRFQSGSDDFSAQISAFKNAGVEIVTGVVVPPDFTSFWTQAAQQAGQFLLHVGEGDLVGIVVHQQRGEAGRRLDDALGAVLRDGAGQTLRHEVQFEIHLVAELDQDEPVAARQEAWLLVDHWAPLPGLCRWVGAAGGRTAGGTRVMKSVP